MHEKYLLCEYKRHHPGVGVTPGVGLQSQSTSGIESGKKCEGQQEGLLQVHQQQKEDQGKCGPTAEWSRGPGDKGHGNGQDTECLLCLGLCW